MFSIRCNIRVKSRINKRNLPRIKKFKSFINYYKWKGINLPSEKDDWKKFEKDNVIITQLFMFQNIT